MAREMAVKTLGEVALRDRDLDKMQEFNETVVGLERLHRIGDSHVLLRVADGRGGHTQIVGLFSERVAPQIEFLDRAAPSETGRARFITRRWPSRSRTTSGSRRPSRVSASRCARWITRGSAGARSTFPTPRTTSSNSSAMTPRWPRPDRRGAPRQDQWSHE